MYVVQTQTLVKSAAALRRIREKLEKRIEAITEKIDILEMAAKDLARCEEAGLSEPTKYRRKHIQEKKPVAPKPEVKKDPKNGPFYRTADALTRRSERLTTKDIARIADVPKHHVSAAICQLRSKGFVKSFASGTVASNGKEILLHEITPQGRMYVATVDARK